VRSIPDNQLKYRLLFLTVIPSPYQQDLFNALSRSSNMDINVLYYASTASDRDWDTPRLADYEKIMPEKKLNIFGFNPVINSGVISEIKNINADLVIVSDYSFMSAQLAMWYLTFTGKKWIYWGEKPGIRQGLFRSWLRSLLMLPIKYSAAVCAIGLKAENVYKTWLKNIIPVFNIPYFCDLRPFNTINKEKHERINVLFSGQFIARKGIDILLQAFDAIADECPDVDLILAGGTRENINPGQFPEKYKDRIKFAGFVQPADLPDLYSHADIFVLPSRYDGWGVVINEALGAGLPVIASDQVGAAHDLVRHGENGFIFPAGDKQQLAGFIKALAGSQELREKFGRTSRQMSGEFGLDEGVRRWKNACENILANAQ
jgi:glycosyltransferase involved in cell wall biosynthesis